MSLDIKNIRKQSDFCLDLMQRLNEEVKKDVDEHAWMGVHNHTQKQADIIRLRRELNKLQKMLNPWGEYYNG